jgi:hypothetical protein
LAVATVLASPARAEWVSPGALARAHADLDKTDACERCHEQGGRVRESRCLSCHNEVAKPLAAGRGYHTKLVKSGKGCASCHREHQGRGFPLIRWSPPAGFDHGAETGFGLAGAHAGTRCGSCHKRRPKYMGAKKTCTGCHEDPHGGKLAGSCDTCHGVTSFRPAPKFSHDKTPFPLRDRHAQVACTACHKPAGGSSRRFDVPGAKRCSTCHGDPHQGRTALSACTACHSTSGWRDTKGLPPAHSPAGYPLVGKHAGVSCRDCHGSSLTSRVSRACAKCHEDAHRGRFGDKCERCHNESGWKLRGAGASRFDHDVARYPLRGAHRRVGCNKCHTRGGSYRQRYTSLRYDTCDRCHQRYHPEALATVAPDTRCEACHVVAGFEPSTFTAASHAKARWPLEGSHRAAPCVACHTRQAPAPTRLAHDKRACVDCHADPHRGQFDAKMAQGGCAACHNQTGWRQGSFDHEATAFPLRGVHARAACASCHKALPKAQQPATGIVARQYKGLPMTCEGCHVDPHFGQFAGPPSPRECAACHNPEQWKIAPFDHAALTAWPLDGKHAPLTCDKCHQPVRVAGADGGKAQAVQYRLGYRECRDCHANPHRKGAR